MKIVTSAQLMQLEHMAINEYGIPSILLMENAALAVLEAVSEALGDVTSKRIVILAGKGNNGGDGLALGRHLVNRGAEVKVFICGDPAELKPDSLLNFRLLKGLGAAIFQVCGETELRAFKLALMTCDLAVDALYGTGFRGALPPVQESYVQALNESGKPVIAVDIPSGLEADTGKIYKDAVRAKVTVTFGLPKLGHFLGRGPEYSGRVQVDKISIPETILDAPQVQTHILTDQKVAGYIPPRAIDGHKGTHGLGIIVGGSSGMTGALALAARALLRSGAGLVQMVTGASIAAQVDSLLLEGTTIALSESSPGVLAPESVGRIQEALLRAKAMAVGPGLGKAEGMFDFLATLVGNCNKPLVLDADALNILALDLKVLEKAQAPVILTPHPAEMARLTGLTVNEVVSNRLELALAKAVEWNVFLVLKGSTTLIVSPTGEVFLNPTGNPILGTGGTGDVLTGCITGFLAQGVPPLKAACLGVYCHGLAGDILAAEMGPRGALAGQVADALPRALKQIAQQV